MSTVIKGGTIVTADRTYEADILVEKGVIVDIGNQLSANETLDATGCYVMPGGIDPHTHLEMPFMGTVPQIILSQERVQPSLGEPPW